MQLSKNYLILDCYVDEPACLGVPPFIAPYPRYIYGFLRAEGIKTENIDYLTIDQLRRSDYRIKHKYYLVILIGGAVVPGKYPGTAIGTIAEINKITALNYQNNFLIGGGAAAAHINKTANVKDKAMDIVSLTCKYLTSKPAKPLFAQTDSWAVTGAELCRLHFQFPHVICEIETARGCPRQSHCSFCYESLKKETVFRSPDAIKEEITALAECGNKRIRLGGQPDILCYGSRLKTYKNGFPAPDPETADRLFYTVKKLKQKYRLKTVNIDNANPGTMVNFPDECRAVLQSITAAITPGDTLSLGFESFDDAVIKKNNLKSNREQALEVIRTVNTIGSGRKQGIPLLLPGINLLQGLAGENRQTFKINYEFLKKVKNEGLLVKRINIRRVLLYPGTVLFEKKPKNSTQLLNRFYFYKAKIRKEIEQPMLVKIFPPGTVLKNMRMLEQHNGYTMAKQLNSYAITAKIPFELPAGTFCDTVVCRHRERSLGVIPLPLPLSRMDRKAFKYLPGVNNKSASELVLAKPYKTLTQLRQLLSGTPEQKAVIKTAAAYAAKVNVLPKPL
ncbi:MAG TPA: radical SAM protein [Spirochaetota bacterium]|nr:radical SAM protein [Spirochaetota bacterium]